MHITELGRKFGFSRGTLLYYDRIGLLSPSTRNKAGYRIYSEADEERLASIRSFRQAGLTLDDIRRILSTGKDANKKVLHRRMAELGEEIRQLQSQQQLLGKMLQMRPVGKLPAAIDKQAWIAMLRAAGMDQNAMNRWHSEFEHRSPRAHHAFLLGLGISEEEAQFIRKSSRGKKTRKTRRNR